MAILFSAVTATADDEQVEFLCARIPRELDDLEGWVAFEDFLGEIDKETEVTVYVETYLCGEAETYTVTPEEVTYMQMRIYLPPTHPAFGIYLPPTLKIAVSICHRRKAIKRVENG